MDVSNTGQLKTGVVTFLDVLGWKGGYFRVPNIIGKMESIINEVIAASSTASSKGLNAKEMADYIKYDIVSDTIVITTPVDFENAHHVIYIHAVFAMQILHKSISAGIPMRGCIAYGLYDKGERSFAGPAVDEAASWHELADWIGVTLAPSAELRFCNSAQKSEALYKWNVFIKHKVPFKKNINWSFTEREFYCVAWPAFGGECSIDTLKEGAFIDWESLCLSLIRLAPIHPEFADKIFNTLNFAESCIEKRKTKTI